MGFRHGSGPDLNPAAMTTAAALEAKGAALGLNEDGGSRDEWVALFFEAVNRAHYCERLIVAPLSLRSVDDLVAEPRGNVIPLRGGRRR